MSVEFSLDTSKVRANMKRLTDQIGRSAVAAVRAELEIEKRESQARTPVDTGALWATHTVKVEETGSGVEGKITAGGPMAPYAVIVHEDTTAHHPKGQAKFLESTIRESAAHLPARIAARMRQDL